MKFLLPLLVVCLLAGPVFAQIPDLIISEYIEGSSYNKAIEIYNGTESPVNLGIYTLELYSNGSTDPVVIPLGSVDLNARNTFVVANPSAVAAILEDADLASSALNFNGNDALVLRRDGLAVDRLGQVGFDPGTSWACDDGSTYNATLRRRSGVCSGDDNLFAPFDPCDEYDFFPNDTANDLGYHVDDCHSVGSGETSWDALKAHFK